MSSHRVRRETPGRGSRRGRLSEVDGAHRVAIAAHLGLESVPVCVVSPPDFEVQDYTEFIRRRESLCDRAIEEVVRRTKPSSGHGVGTVRTNSSNCVGRRRDMPPGAFVTAFILPPTEQLYRHLLEIHDGSLCGSRPTGVGRSVPVAPRISVGQPRVTTSRCRPSTRSESTSSPIRSSAASGGEWLLRSHGTATTADYTVLLEPVSSRRDILKRYLSDHRTELVTLLVAELDNEIAGAVY